MSNGNFSTGQTVPLAVPSSIRREWERNGVTGADLIEAEAEYADAQGYVFEWGQIIEELTDLDECDKPDDPDGPGVQWHFALTDMHHEFLDAGGNLAELADYCLALLDGFFEDAGIERALGDGLPDFISLQDGNSISAFEFMACGTVNIDRARRWMDRRFIPRVLPALIARLRIENRAAASEASSNRAQAAP